MELRSLGKYELLESLAMGSDDCRFFSVRHEDEPDAGRPRYMAKLLSPGRGSQAEHRRARFEHEIRLLKAFNHPSIPTLHASGEQDGVAFMVMDRVNGIDLATVLGHREGRAQPLAKEVAVYIMGQLADALRHVHTIELLDEDEPQSLGIVHRDIRPSNVLLSPGGDAVLIGFGAARSQWLEPEHDDRMAGDLAYMAPERLTEAGTATEHSDLFALAVLLWEMLRGERCLAGPDEASTRENITRFEIAQASRRVPGLSPKLSEILRKNLDRDPGRRYGSAYQMLQRLAQAPEAQVAEQSRAELGARVRAASS